MQLPVLPQGDVDVSTTSSQPPAPQRCILESITGALSDTQLAVASMHKRVEDLERNLHSRTRELNAVKAEFAEFKTSVEKQLADIHSVMTGRVPADAPGQHSGLPCELRMCRLPAYVDGLRSGPSYVFARLESIINPDYPNYGIQNPAASGWSELSHKEHARQTAQETRERLSRMIPDYIQRKDALTNQQKERSAKMQMRMEEEKEERREAFWKKRADERLREAIHAGKCWVYAFDSISHFYTRFRANKEVGTAERR
jgi:predicted  nucleic acid-binding Zn-ribbon protein